MRSHNFYSMTAFNQAVQIILPNLDLEEIKLVKNYRIEILKLCGLELLTVKNFINDLPKEKRAAFDILTACAIQYSNDNHLVFGSKSLNDRLEEMVA